MEHSKDLPLVRFGATDLRVTRYCQGTAFRRLDRSAGDPRGQTVLRRCLDLGVNFFDSSNAYGWGGAEEALGKAIAGHRQEVVICTKVSPSAPPGPDGVSERLRFTRAFLLDQIEACLRRLATDCVDLYLLHNPDSATPPQEIVAIMDEVVRSGKARYWGASNHSAAQVCEFLELSRASDKAPFSGTELYYNIGARGLEDAMFPLLRRTGLGLVAFSPLAGGKMAPERTPQADAALAELLASVDRVAAELGATRAQVCIAWVLAHPAVTTVLAGAESVEHVDENVAGTQLVLPPGILTSLDAASDAFRRPGAEV